MNFRILPFLLAVATSCGAADGIKSKTTHAAAYGPTNNAVMVDPAKDLPRYPAVEPKDAIGTWQVKKGFKLELAANEPQVRDPIAICFDEKGRMFVCEMIDYSEMRDVTPHLGRISMLEDKDDDGHYETSTVFADDLPWPTGLIWVNGGLFVGATPDIWRFEDKDGDGKAEVREKVYTGFGTGLKLLNVQGLMNSFQWGQDNKIHVLAGGGNRGLIKCLKRGDLPEQELGGKDFWFNPLNYDFGLEGGGAQYGMSFDNYGRKFGCSNSDHLQYWVYDSKYAARNPYYSMPSARTSIAVDGGAAEVFRLSPDEPWRIIRTRWRIAGVVKGSVEGGGRVSGYFTGATGTTIYRGDAYGPDFVNNSFSGDAGGQLVHRKIIRPSADGISLVGERPADERGFEFAASKDTWVRVVNFANAPDGCLYICDMYREVIEHPWSVPDEIKKHLDLNNGNDRGRIYRVAPDKGDWQRRKMGSLAKASTEQLVETLSHPNGWHRDTAARLLFEHQDKAAIPMLEERITNLNEPIGMLHRLAVMEGLGGLTEKAIMEALSNPDEHVRERGLSLLAGAPSEAMWEKLVKLTRDASPRVRFQLALTLGGLKHPKVASLLATLPAGDPWSCDAILSAPPELALSIQNKRNELKTGYSERLTPGLFSVIGARNDPAEVTSVIAQLGAASGSNTTLIAALAEGLKRAGTTIEKVDTEKKLAAAFGSAATTVADNAASESSRLEAIPLVALSEARTAIPALRACLSGDQSEKLQTAGIKSLATFGKPEVTQAFLTNWPTFKPKAREAALTALLAREDRTIALLEAVTAATIKPADLSAADVQSLIKHKEAKVATLARTALASVIPPSREEVTKKFQPAAAAKGDVAKGQIQFMARCLACHRANGVGMDVAPELVTVKTKGRDALLTAILEPHKEVASQYIAYTILTKDGQTLSGIIARDDANSMTLKMMGGAETTVQRSNIKGSTSSGQSLMPEGLEQGMSVQDMADLLSFIEAAK